MAVEYTSKAALVARWGADEVTRSADRDPQDGVDDVDAIAEACADASSLVESYVGTVDPPSKVLVMHATNVAMYLLSQAVGGAYTDEKRKRYDDALSWLKMMGKKAEVPGLPDADKEATGVRTSGFPLAYQAGNLRGGGLI